MARDKNAEKIKQDVMMQMAKADQLDGRTKEGKDAQEKACVLLLLALRAGIELNPNDPLFQNFIRRRSWRTAMRRVCEQVANPSTKIGRDVLVLAKAIPCVSNFISALLDLGKNHGIDPLLKAKEYNEDLWNEFFDQIPRDGGGGPSLRRDLDQLKLVQKRQGDFVKAALSRKRDLSNVA